MHADRVVVASANLRDLGGLPTADGRMTRPGRLFRSGRLSDLTPEELSHVQDLGLKTVVDLRRADEVAQHPAPPLQGAEIINVPASTDDNEFAVIVNQLDDPTMAERAQPLAHAYFSSIVTDKLPLFRPAFDLATDPARGPLLFHCAGGKDRAGFVAATLLRILGVDKEMILGDYLYTNVMRRDRIDEIVAAHRERIASERGIAPTRVGPRDLLALRTVLHAQTSFLDAAFDTADAEYGNFHNFCRTGLGLTDHRVQAFREMMLE